MTVAVSSWVPRERRPFSILPIFIDYWGTSEAAALSETPLLLLYSYCTLFSESNLLHGPCYFVGEEGDHIDDLFFITQIRARLNMELDLRSLIGLLFTAVLIG